MENTPFNTKADILPTIWVDLNHYAVISVKGLDAHKFLQGQLTANLDDISRNQSSLAGFCNQKGRLRAIIRIIQIDDNIYYLKLPKAILTATLAQLKKYGMFSKITFEDLQEKIKVLGLSGPMAENILAQLKIPPTPPFQRGEPDVGGYPKTMQGTVHQNNISIIRIPGFSPRFEIMGPAIEIEKLQEKLQASATLVDTGNWQLIDIRLGIPEVLPETVEQLLPHSINLPELKAVSFSKGCYCGQEIVARMHYRGNLKRHLYHALLEDTVLPIPGTILWVQAEELTKSVGSVIIARTNENDRIELLIELDENFADSHIQMTENGGASIKILARTQYDF